MKNRLYLYLLFFVLLLVIIFFIFLANDFYYNLVIKTFPEEKIIFQKRISSEKKFALVYIHSVAQTPVWEFFKIDNEGNLILYETHFHDHGAGLPYAAFGEEVFVREENRFKIKNMHREVELPLYYRIYEDRGNVFIFESQEINLSENIGDALLTLDIQRLSAIDYFLKSII
jgi:hypothetical protein